jgi:hypothetical protein
VSILKQAAAAAILALLVSAPPADAETLTVDRNDDANASACTSAPVDCTLRGALNEIELLRQLGSTGDMKITIPAMRVTAGASLPPANRVTIAGAGARQTVVDGGNRADGLFVGNAILQDMTVTGAKSDNAAVSLRGGELDRVAIVGNKAVGLRAMGTLVSDSVVARNDGVQGGGIITDGAIILRDSTVAENTAHPLDDPFNSVGIVFNAGVFTSNGSVIERSTIVRNRVADGATPLSGVDLGTVTAVELPLVMRSSVVGGGADSVCGGLIESHGNNVASDSSCRLDQSSDRSGADLKLGPLADNGGPTDTVALLDGSPAIDAGAGCAPTDQRGVTRAQGAACDAGAFESPFSAPSPPAPALPPAPSPAPTPTPPPVVVNPPPPPADRTPPSLTVGRLPSKITRATLRSGLKVRIGASERVVAEVTLLGPSSSELAAASLAVGDGTRTVKLKAARRPAGKKALRAQLRVVAFDLAGNRSVRTVRLTIR